MIIATSIAPSHLNGNIQEICVDSWLKLGYNVYSFNHPEEIAEIEKQYPKVIFVPTYRTMELTFGKKYVQINAILDFAKEHADDMLLIINSDIEIDDTLNVIPSIIERSQHGITMVKRMDYEISKTIAKRYEHGIDAFFIHKNFLHIFPQAIYCMGQTFWDYWIPYRTVNANVPLFNCNEPLIYHKEHKYQYDLTDWARIGKYFQWENNLERYTTNIGKMSNFIYQTFMQRAR